MEVTTVSCTQKITAEIEILDFSKLEWRHDNLDNDPVMFPCYDPCSYSELPFTVGLISSYDGKIAIKMANGRLISIKLFIPEVKFINLTIILNGEQFDYNYNYNHWKGLDLTGSWISCEKLKCKILQAFEHLECFM